MDKRSLDKLAKDIGTKVRDRREKKGITMGKLADGAGVSPEAIFKIEKGNNLPSIRILAKIGHYFKVKLRELLP